MTYREAKDWHKAQVGLMQTKAKDEQLNIWLLGRAVRTAIVSAFESSVQYPDFYEMFPAHKPKDYDRKQEAMAIEADRHELADILRANAHRVPQEGGDEPGRDSN